MNYLTVIIIAKNAEELIEDCLKSLSFAEEIILVNNSSTDKTVEIAKKFDARIVNCNAESFAEKRSQGLKTAKGEWILYIDVDERVSVLLREEIIKYINNPINNITAFRIKRKNFYLGNHEWPFIEKLERLFKREKLTGWHGKLHESPIIDGEVGEIENGFILHFTHRDLTSMLEKTITWSTIEAELRYNAHHPVMTWWRFPRVMLSAFNDSYFKQGGWKIGTPGLLESMYQAFSIFVTYAKLWELQQGKLKMRNEK